MAKLAVVGLLARMGPDEILFRTDERPQEVSFLLTGAVATEITRTGGVETIIDVVQPPRVIGLSALLDAPAIAGARTLTSARLVMLSAPALRAILEEDSSLALAFLSIAIRESQMLALEVCQLRLLSAPQRLAAYMISLVADPNMNPVRLVLPITRTLLAARVGCTPENMSRAIKALRPIGVVTQGAVVVISDLSKLRAYVGLVGDF